MPTYTTPGVWVEEIPTLPPSVAPVATAVPAFLGYTEQGSGVARVSNLLEYEELFGRANPAKFKATPNADGGIDVVRTDAASNNFLLYYGLGLYFRNGGGPCYVVSVGNYGATPARADFEKGLAALEQEDEPTLIVLLDAVNLPKTDYYALAQAALAQCGKLGDRFSVLDVPRDKPDIKTDIADFRNGVGTAYLSYGAAYHPYLQSVLNYQYQEDDVQVSWPQRWASADNGIVVSYSRGGPAKLKIVAAANASAIAFDASTEPGTLTLSLPSGKDTTGTDAATAWKAWTQDRSGFDLAAKGDGSSKLAALAATSLAAVQQSLTAIKNTNTALYNQTKAALAGQRVVLPPSPALAGIYARVDGERGVWKAPANVSISAIVGPVAKISNDDQGRLNVDDSGKSINAIRDFTGKGTLVWGARTLAGNDNEWRYVPVRRLFITIEESTRKATGFAVFEPNDATTWLKVKAMIDSYLYGLWEQGALAGAKPEQAYFVQVGLGKTMTAQDVLEGRMIVEIGVAAVRPAEFIILRFYHKMQEA